MNLEAITGMAARIGFDPRVSNPSGGLRKANTLAVISHAVIAPDRMLIPKNMLINGGHRPS